MRRVTSAKHRAGDDRGMTVDHRFIDTVPILLPEATQSVEFVIHIDEPTGTVRVEPTGNI